MNSDALVVAAAIGIAACAMLVGLSFASWIAGRARSAPPEPVLPATVLPPSVAEGVAAKQLPVLAQELSAHANSAAAQAARARAALAAARTALTAAETARARAEAEFDAVHTAHVALLRSVPRQDPQTEERERQVSRAALDAYRRGELSVEALRNVFGHADPSPEREQREREADRLALLESQARRAFQHAVAAARHAREELHVAEVAEAAVRQEAADAALEAQDVALAVRARRRRRGGRRPD